MREFAIPIKLSVLLLTLVGCSLIPSASTTPTPTGSPAIPPSGYEPQLEDEKLTRGQAFLELKDSSLAVMESYPVQVSAILNGNLPDPCHQLRVVVKPADEKKQINLEVYSVADTSKVCITVLKPFTATVKLGTFSSGHYTVYVNGELLGEFDG